MENIDEEWKEVWKAEYLKTVSAFYNTAGGRMVVGRRDSGETVGVADPKGTLKSISDSIRNTLDISAQVSMRVIDGHECIVIEVPKGRAIVDFNGVFYKRMGNTTQQIRKDELKEIILRERGIQWMDLPSDFSVSDASAEAVSRFVSMGKSERRIPEDVDGSDVEGVLRHYGLLCDDGAMTIAGALMFHPNPSSFHFGAFLKIGEFDSRGILRREDYLEMPVILIPNAAVDMLFDKYIPPTFIYEGARRKLFYRYPRDALRELIVNAVVHMDYQAHSPVAVAVYPDRVEVSCFGGLPEGWTVQTLLGMHDSILRNKTMAQVFHGAGYVENWAQGIRKVIEGCRVNGNPAPDFTLTSAGLHAVVFAAQFEADTAGTVLLSKTQRDILDCIVNNPSVSVGEMAETIGVTDRTVSNNLSKMVKEGIIVREGSRKAGMWIVVMPGSSERV